MSSDEGGVILDKYADLLASIREPLTDEEAKVLVGLFGPDDAFGLEWTMIGLIESAPGWPLEGCLQDRPDNEWVELLKIRLRNRNT